MHTAKTLDFDEDKRLHLQIGHRSHISMTSQFIINILEATRLAALSAL